MTRSTDLRCLVVGSADAGSLEGIYARALRRTGSVSVAFFNTARYRVQLPGGGLGRRAMRTVLSAATRVPLERMLVRYCRRSGSHDVVLLFKGMEFSRATLERCRVAQPHAIWANYNPDDPLSVGSRGSSNERVRECLAFFDVYLTWSRQLVHRLLAAGCRRVEHLPFGFDSELHSPPGATREVSPDVVTFVGAWDRQREAVLSAIRTYNLRIHGDGWDRAANSSGLSQRIVPRNIHGLLLACAVHNAAVSLNILRPQNFGSHNMRTFEIPAMGGLMLTTRSNEQNEFFPEGDACLMYDGVDELSAQLDRVLNDKRLASRIRVRGRLLAQPHSYDQRAVDLVRILRAVRAEGQ